VIFSSVRTSGDGGYEAMSLRMQELARLQPGFLGLGLIHKEGAAARAASGELGKAADRRKAGLPFKGGQQSPATSAARARRDRAGRAPSIVSSLIRWALHRPSLAFAPCIPASLRRDHVLLTDKPSESVRDAEGRGITVSYWADEESVARWKRDAGHTAAQEMGRSRWYESYALRVCRVLRTGRHP
jgi:heme-degrading monooxygenase HmoA